MKAYPMNLARRPMPYVLNGSIRRGSSAGKEQAEGETVRHKGTGEDHEAKQLTSALKLPNDQRNSTQHGVLEEAPNSSDGTFDIIHAQHLYGHFGVIDGGRYADCLNWSTPFSMLRMMIFADADSVAQKISAVTDFHKRFKSYMVTHLLPEKLLQWGSAKFGADSNLLQLQIICEQHPDIAESADFDHPKIKSIAHSLLNEYELQLDANIWDLVHFQIRKRLSPQTQAQYYRLLAAGLRDYGFMNSAGATSLLCYYALAHTLYDWCNEIIHHYRKRCLEVIQDSDVDDSYLEWCRKEASPCPELTKRLAFEAKMTSQWLEQRKSGGRGFGPHGDITLFVAQNPMEATRPFATFSMMLAVLDIADLVDSNASFVRQYPFRKMCKERNGFDMVSLDKTSFPEEDHPEIAAEKKG